MIKRVYEKDYTTKDDDGNMNTLSNRDIAPFLLSESRNKTLEFLLNELIKSNGRDDSVINLIQKISTDHFKTDIIGETLYTMKASVFEEMLNLNNVSLSKKCSNCEDYCTGGCVGEYKNPTLNPELKEMITTIWYKHLDEAVIYAKALLSNETKTIRRLENKYTKLKKKIKERQWNNTPRPYVPNSVPW